MSEVDKNLETTLNGTNGTSTAEPASVQLNFRVETNTNINEYAVDTSDEEVGSFLNILPQV